MHQNLLYSLIDGHWELTPKKVVHAPDFLLPHCEILRTTKMVFDDIEFFYISDTKFTRRVLARLAHLFWDF